MNKFENPIQFDIEKKIGNIELVYIGLMEIFQGAPEVGTIVINGIEIPNYHFGGPWLLNNGYVYIPVYVKKFFNSGFKLARINVENLNIEFLGKVKDLIFLDKVEGNKLYYFEDLDSTIYNYYDLVE